MLTETCPTFHPQPPPLSGHVWTDYYEAASLSTRVPICSASRKVDGASSQLKVLIMYLVDTFMFICTLDEGESSLGR